MNAVVKLCGDLNFTTARQQHDHMRRFIANNLGQNIVVDLSEVQHSDSAGVALLIEILRIAAKSHQTVLFQQLPAQMQALVQFCNLSPIIQANSSRCCEL